MRTLIEGGWVVAYDGKSHAVKWWSVPKGQIQPQNTRPKTSVSATSPSDQKRPR